jgi:hypothetical protein
VTKPCYRVRLPRLTGVIVRVKWQLLHQSVKPCCRLLRGSALSLTTEIAHLMRSHPLEVLDEEFAPRDKHANTSYLKISGSL